MKLYRENSKRELRRHETLTHPLEQSVGASDRAKFKYLFLRATREPTPDRPDSGRILVQDHEGEIKEFYSLLFSLRWADV